MSDDTEKLRGETHCFVHRDRLVRAEAERDAALKQSAEWEVQAQDMRDRAVAAEKRLADLRGKVEGLTRWKADITTVGDVHLYMHSLGDVFKVSEVLAMLEDVTR